VVKDISILEKELEAALMIYEQQGKYDLALERYQEVEKAINQLVANNKGDLTDAYKLQAQCFLRQAGMLRQLGRFEEASVVNKKEIESARRSGNSIAYAQSLFSSGINCLSNRQIQEGISLLEDAKRAFEKGDSMDHKQGVGWYWVILADLGNKKITCATNEEIIQFANKAIEILTDIENIPGIKRAYQARATVYQNMGEVKRAEEDLLKFQAY
jgi:tetratricopeptide (TPR) repeat protein